MRTPWSCAARFALVALIFALCADSRAYELRLKSMQEQLQSSDLVFVGDVIEAGPVDRESGVYGSVGFSISSLIKGETSIRSAVFITRGQFMEADPDCCDPSSRYLVFARRRPDGLYYAVNGPISTFRIEGGQVLNWPDGVAKDPSDLEDVVACLSTLVDPEEAGSAAN